VIEATREFITPSRPHPYIVLCGVRNQAELARERERIRAYGIRVVDFHEPDLNAGLTVVATEPLSKEARRPMRRYRLLHKPEGHAEGGAAEPDTIAIPDARGPP